MTRELRGLLDRDFGAVQPNGKWGADDGFHNPARRHSARDFISSVQFERLAAN